MTGQAAKIIKHLGYAAQAPFKLSCRALKAPLRPTRIVMMATDNCNSRCLHCSIWRKEPTRDQLSPAEAEKLLSDPLFRDVRYILCTGGEPTYRKDIAEFYLAMHRALPKATLQLSTNGIFPDRALEVASVCIKNKIDFEIGVSLDGVGADHDRIRGIPGNFARTEGLFKELAAMRKDHPFPIFAGIVISDLTIDSIQRVREYCRGMCIELVEAWYNMSDFYGNTRVETRANMESKIRAIVKTQPPSPVRDLWLRLLDRRPIAFPCFAMNTFCVVKCNGDICPCLTKWDETIGNARDNSALKLWNSAQGKKVRESVGRCSGCLNAWGAGWSLEDCSYPVIAFALRYPSVVLKPLFEKR
jgi:MoaA/NifB/PqqE/SkfB family radical SAM enzyme